MNSKITILGAAILGVVAFSGSASALGETSTGTLTVTGDVVSSISLTIDSAGGATTALGTAAASTDLGDISKFGGNVPAGFTRTVDTSDWTLTSTIGVMVTKANLTSTGYTLNAKLDTAPVAGVAWTVNSVLLTSSVQALTSGVGYGAPASYSWVIEIQDSVPAGAIDNVIMFDAVAA